MKDFIISKELLSEVLDIKIEDIVEFRISMNELFYYQRLLTRVNCQGKISKHREPIQQSINIYEFAYKCKEWLTENKIDFTIWATDKYRFYSEKYHLDIEADTEVELIVKACNWVLEEMRK